MLSWEDFFSLAGRSNALQSTVIVQCTGIIMNIVSIVLVENHSVGRWLLFMIGLFFQGGGLCEPCFCILLSRHSF